MSDQQFINSYVRILNDTINELMNKNIVMQAQLEVSKTNGARVAELEAKVKELTNISSDNNALQTQLNNLKSQLDNSNAQLNNKNGHVETFKRELIEARTALKNATMQHEIQLQVLQNEWQKKVESLNSEIELLKVKCEELKSKKRKKEEKEIALNTIEPAFVADNNLITVSDTF
jgi:chromosome segregation ATPase